jgi:hypothetical protein
MFPPVFQVLKASAAVKAVVGTNPPRIYRHGTAPQDTTRPYITWFVVTAPPENQLSGTPTTDKSRIQIDLWHDTDAGIVSLMTAVRDAVETEAHITGTPVNERDPETKMFHIALDMDWFVDRTY